MEFSAEWGDPSYANYAQAAWAWQTSAASSPYITDLRYMDGNQSYLYNYFVTGPGGGSAGYGAWQASDYGLAAWEMGDTIWAQHMASVINSSINNIASATTCRDLGMAWALKLLWTVDKVTYATGISTLKTDLKNDQLPSGSWHDGNPDGDPQTTAYAVMGLLGAGEYSAARKGADWLIGTQLINGGWEASPDEYSEIDSEAAQASATSIVQLTVASAYDSPYPSIGTTSYLVGTSVTANVTSPASGSAGTQYVCTGWTGTGDVPASGTGTTVTFTINLDSNITWNWKTQYNITFAQSDVSTDFTGSVMNVNGTDYDRSGHSDWYDSGATINFSFYSPLVVPPGAKEYHWNSTSGLSSLQSGSIFVTGSGSVTGNYVTRVHDVAVTNVVANRTWVYQGKSCGFGVNVTVLNKGDFPETVNITLYYNITANQIIGTQTINLLPEESQTLAFMWNTIGVEYCHNYTLTAVANIIPLDNDPADNTFTDGKVKVRILGDINGDGIVDMKDITTIINAFGTTLGRPRWNPEADLNNDNVVDLKDVTIALRNYGKTE